MRIAAFQGNPIVGDLEYNASEIRSGYQKAREASADVVVFPELFLTGYPPEDLVLRSSFLSAVRSHSARLGAMTVNGPDLFLPTLHSDNGRIWNAVQHWSEGAAVNMTAKRHLPNYGVFDEKRYFHEGVPNVFVVGDKWLVGVAICEDAWNRDVCHNLRQQGAEVIISVNGSPYEDGKWIKRDNLAASRAKETGVPFIYLNMVGGQDEIVFDGRSFAIQADTRRVIQLPAWQEAGVIIDLDINKNTGQTFLTPVSLTSERETTGDGTDLENMFHALVTGTRDYVNKNGFSSVVLGLSGGIDSALVAVIAAQALGPDRVSAIMLPSEHTSQLSLDLAAECATNLSIAYEVIDRTFFEDANRMIYSMIRRGAEVETLAGLTAENIHARLRGNVLMGVSNETGAMLLTTGNKSEMSVGYATLYGDMSGGFNPLKDVYKTDVFALARWINAIQSEPVIPEGIITRPPSAELSEGQKDSDSLPPYDILDPILMGLVDEELSVDEVVERTGASEEVVLRIAGLVLRAEYKRRQSAPGVKVTRRNFGRDRRYPITNGYRERA